MNRCSDNACDEPLSEEEALQNIRSATVLEEMPGEPISVSGYRVPGKTVIIIDDEPAASSK